MNETHDSGRTPADTQGSATPAAPPQAPTDTGGYLRLWQNSAFRKLWVAQFVSSMGDWLIIGILIPTVTELSGGSSMAVAGIMIAKILPALLLSSFVGAIVDRFPRRDVMLIADLVRLGLVLILLFTNSLFTIYIVIFFMEIFSLFFWPARNALIPNIVQDRDVRIANGFMYTTHYVAMILGLAASGAIMRAFDASIHFLINLNLGAFSEVLRNLSPVLLGSRAGYFVDSFTFILSALMIILMHKSSEKHLPQPDSPLDFKTIGKDAIDSFRFLGQNADLRGLLISAGIAIIGGGAIVPVGLNHIATLEGIIPFADRLAWLNTFSGSRQIFILTWMGVGMASGAFLVPKLEKRFSPGRLFPRTIAAFAIGMFLFALNRTYFLACLMAAGGGFCISMLSVTGNNYIVQNVANDLRGRVFTALEAVIQVALLISMIITAPLSDFIGGIVLRLLADFNISSILGSPLTGPRITLIFAGLIVAAAAVYCFRKMREGLPTGTDDTPVGGEHNAQPGATG